MSFTPINKPIPIQPGIKAYNFYASGVIYKGQAVAGVKGPDNKNYVMATNHSSQRMVGIAAFTADSGEPIAIFGPYNMVRAMISGSVLAGTVLGAGEDCFLYENAGDEAILLRNVPSTDDGIVLLI